MNIADPSPKARYPESVLDTIVFISRLQKERPDSSLETIAASRLVGPATGGYPVAWLMGGVSVW